MIDSSAFSSLQHVYWIFSRSFLKCSLNRSSCIWHAAHWPSLYSANAGTSLAHTSFANGQRVRNTHPLGGLIGLGNSPLIWILSLFRSTSGSGIGTALNNALVYGCSGDVYSLSLGAISIIFPKYMTPTRSLM